MSIGLIAFFKTGNYIPVYLKESFLDLDHAN